MERISYRMDQAAEVLGVSRSRLDAEVRAGRLPAIRVGRTRFVRRSDLEAWLDARQAESAKP